MAEAQVLNPQQGDESILEEAKNLLAQGKRYMALEDFQSATDHLEQSCRLFDAFYGVAKRDCADAYFEYGLALVALANVEAGADRIMKTPGAAGDEEEEEEEDDYEEDEEEEDGNEDENQVEGGEEKAKENGQTDNQPNKDNQGQKSNGTIGSNEDQKLTPTTTTQDGQDKQAEPMELDLKQPSENGNTSKSQPEPTPGTSSGAEPQPGSSSNDADEEDVENEEATTIEVAWEVLCLAKRLFMTDESLEGRLKLAETLQKIGEISIEWDNNDNAVSILEDCLKIREAILPPDDRLIALTYYHLGLAHSFKQETQEANDSFQKAIDVIEKRIASVSSQLKKAKESEDTASANKFQKEINELKDLLPDMTMRLDDSKEDGLKSNEIMKRTREEMQQEDEVVKKVCSDSSKPVDDISHLVKRKAT